MWPDSRLTELFGVEHPIVLAPMAGAMDVDLAVAVAEAGGLGSLPGAMLTADALHRQVEDFRSRTGKPVNVNFFCHVAPVPNNAREAQWRETLAPYYRELGIDPAAPLKSVNRAPFDEAFCVLVEDLKPAVVSFHFGLPEPALLARVKAAGCRVISSATTVAEAVWLERRGADAIVAQGAEAGGHRGMFLTDDIAGQAGTFALVPQVVDAVEVPVIASGGIGDGRGIAAAFALGAAGVQIGTAYLPCPESRISAPYRTALASARDDGTALTNVMSGRPARGIVNRLIREVGPVTPLAPQFPLAAAAVAPLRAKAEAAGSGDFSPMWAGQAAALGRAVPARETTERLVAQAQAELRRLGRAAG